MTDKRDFKSIVRDRQRKTGESYTTARAHVERERKRLLGIPDGPPAATLPIRVEAAVLDVESTLAEIRPLGTDEEMTFRAPGIAKLAPGQIITAKIDRLRTRVFLKAMSRHMLAGCPMPEIDHISKYEIMMPVG